MKTLRPYILVDIKDRKNKSSIIVADEDKKDEIKKKDIIVTEPFEGCVVCKKDDKLVLRENALVTIFTDDEGKDFSFVVEGDIIAIF